MSGRLHQGFDGWKDYADLKSVKFENPLHLRFR